MKANFKQKYLHTHLRCPLCDDKNDQDDQQHVILCKVLKENHKSNTMSQEKPSYEDIFSENIQKQKEITSLYVELFNIRKALLLNNCQVAPSSTDIAELAMRRDLQPSIDFSLPGNINK